MADLTAFEGRDVVRSKIEIRGVGGGLQEAVDFAPVEIHHNQRLRVVLDLVCTEVKFVALKDSDDVVRSHVLRLGEDGAAIVAGPLADEIDRYVRSERDRIVLAREQAAGIFRLVEGEE